MGALWLTADVCKAVGNSESPGCVVTAEAEQGDACLLVSAHPFCGLLGCCSAAQSWLLLCDPVDAARQASPSSTVSRSLFTLMFVELVMPSNHLILWVYLVPRTCMLCFSVVILLFEVAPERDAEAFSPEQKKAVMGLMENVHVR